jgi:2-polyprenyl-3-methyl-5-hydroxy-6-metoxy-1,4-benzoquinol methylase
MMSNDLPSIYPKNYYSFDSTNYNILYKVKFVLDKVLVKKTMRHYSGAEISILDIGGGTGKLAGLARDALDIRNARTYVVDLDDEAREEAERDGHTFDCSTFEEWIAPEKMDLILAYNILEHVSDPRRFLRKASDVLSPEGRIILQTPNYKALDARLFKKLYWGGLHTPRHFFLFSRESLKNEILGANLKIVSHSSTQAGHFWVCSILGTLQKFSVTSYKKPMYSRVSYKIMMPIFVAFDFARIRFLHTSQQLLVLERLT